jgi:hypothetical protein
MRTRERIRLINKWLKLDEEERERACPFGLFHVLFQFHCLDAYSFCGKYFSKVKDDCPCNMYTHDHVVKVARRIVEEVAKNGRT